MPVAQLTQEAAEVAPVEPLNVPAVHAVCAEGVGQ